MLKLFNKLYLLICLTREDHKYIKCLGYAVPVKVLKTSSSENTYTPAGYPSEYVACTNFTEYVTLLLEDGRKILLTRKFGDDYRGIELSIEAV